MAAKDVSLRNRVERAMESMRERVPMRQALSLMRPDHGVLVLTMSNTETKSISSLAAELHERADDCLRKENDWRALIGVGEFQPAIADVYVSYDQARKAAELAGLLSPATGVAEWARLGVYQTLVDLPADTHGLETLHPGLAKLFAAKDSDVWLQTLEVFLDLAGDARGAAKLLFVNRGTLYHRIHRIEEIAGIDMNNGMDRLALHLGLKLLRLSGTLKTLNPVDP